jgi:predicted metal-dependent hydrolase
LRLRQHKGPKFTYSDGSTLTYLGRKYPLQIIDAQDNTPESISFSKGKFIAKAKRKDPTIIRALYETWLENRTATILEKKVNEYSDVLSIERDKIRINIKSQKNRLGSLGRKLTINFNKNLLRLPPKIIDYVIVHELCHTKIPNHSPAYWHIVGLVIPDYKNRKEWLRMNKQVLVS